MLSLLQLESNLIHIFSYTETTLLKVNNDISLNIDTKIVINKKKKKKKKKKYIYIYIYFPLSASFNSLK